MKDKLKKFNTHSNVNYLIIVAIWLVLFIMDKTGTLKNGTQAIIVTVGINIVLAVSLNLLVGYLGNLTLGHAGFMCIGAFVGKYISLTMDAPLGVTFAIAILVGGLFAAVFGLIIAIPTMRLRGDYLAIVTLAFGEIVRNIIMNMELFGGAMGLKGNTKATNYTVICIAILVTLYVVQNLIHSRHGRAIRSINDNEIAARSIAINVPFYKIITFVIAAFFAGVAGVLYSHSITTVQSTAFSYNYSIEILVFVVLGGMGNLRGCMIATAVITVIPIAFGFLQDYRMLIYSIVLIIMMIANASPKVKEFMFKFNSKFNKFKKVTESSNEPETEVGEVE